MGKQVGRDVKFEWGNGSGGIVKGKREKSLTFNLEPINVTDDDDSGKQTLLEASGEESIEVSVEGLTTDEELIKVAAREGETTLIKSGEIQFPYGDGEGDKITGNFRLNSLELGAPYNEALTFSATFQSTGSWTYVEGEV